MGIRKKVTICFASLAALVVGAGAVSFFELRRVSVATQQILDASNRNMSISRDLLDGAEMMHLAALGGETDLEKRPHNDDSLYRAGRALFRAALAQGHDSDAAAIGSIETAWLRYDHLTDNLLTHPREQWLADYRTAYLDLTAAIKNYMTGAEYNLGTHADALRQNAYRAITPSLVTLGVVLVLVVMLLYLFDIYYTRPMVEMNRGAREWLQQGTPFNVKVEGRDETGELRESILELMTRIRRSSTKQE